MNIKQKFWQNIKMLRKKQNISQEKLAELSWLHRTYISIVERWEKNISLENIEVLAIALKVNLSDLFDNM